MKKIVLIAAVLLMTGCTSKNDAERALRAEGFTDIKITGYDFLACSEDDFYHTGFVAKRNGRTVRGTVCSGILFKGATIRY